MPYGKAEFDRPSSKNAQKMSDDIRSGTRARILEVAQKLFAERGYDGSSLREIAERVGVTKAALYYYFPSKEEIVRALADRLFAGIDVLLDDVERNGPSLEAWKARIDTFINLMFAQRDLFTMMERNRAVFEHLHLWAEDDVHKEDRLTRLNAAMADPSIPLEHQVRVATAVGAAMMTMMRGRGAFPDAAPEEVHDVVVRIAREVLTVPRPSPADDGAAATAEERG